MQQGAPVDLDQLDDVFPSYDDFVKEREDIAKNVKVDPFDTSLLGSGIPNYVLDPSSLDKEYKPLASPEELAAMNKMYSENPIIRDGRPMSPAPAGSVFYDGEGIHKGYKKEEDWIQTHSGRRFNPLNPNPDAIVIQDIAHSLSMMCRFTGHCKKFYSVAQHSVLVSYICDSQDAMWGLLHDASEAYLVDVPRPLKRSGYFEEYKRFEANMQEAVCKRFGLPVKEPASVKKADGQLLVTEARDLMSPLHPDWRNAMDPLPFKIEAWDQQHAKDMFMKRFFELFGSPSGYEHYLMYKDQL